jgi:molybdopterin/thiamine biosynthesis adenylyltransferase
MNTSLKPDTPLAGRSALLIGVGGLGCPAALALVRAGLGRLCIVDDDIVEANNLHRQILFRPEHVGKDKLEIAAAELYARGARPGSIEPIRSRFLPENARALAESVDVVIEGADNFATKFLAADAAKLARRPVVHGAAVRWTATVWAVGARGKPCYRCLFEDLPPGGAAATCAEAGVMGPVVGLAGALMAEFALRVLVDEQPPFGSLFSYDGTLDRLRAVEISARPSCRLCGTEPRISAIDEKMYTEPNCAA